MALAITIVKDIPLAGPTTVNSYVRVESILVAKESASAVATWRQSVPGGTCFDRTEFCFVPQCGRCVFEQAYEALKALPSMAGASDC